MKNYLRTLPAAVLALTLAQTVALPQAQAASAALGSGKCAEIRMGQEGWAKGLQLGTKVANFLEDEYKANGTTVALVGRVGGKSPRKRFERKVSRYWFYTHAGLVYRNHPEGKWKFVHLLNSCSSESGIYIEGMGKFFLDDPYEYRAAVAIPTLKLQKSIEKLIITMGRGRDFRNGSTYSSISYPFSLKTQNSNEYVLDILVAGIAGITKRPQLITNREQSKKYLLSHLELRSKITPEITKVGTWEGLGVGLGLGPGNVTLKDHTWAERRSEKIQMVSVGTLIEFLRDTKNLLIDQEISLKDPRKATDTTIIKPIMKQQKERIGKERQRNR